MRIIESMPEQRSRLLPIVAGIIVCVIGADVARRLLAPKPAPPVIVAEPSDTTRLAASVEPVAVAGRDTVALARVRQRIAEDSAFSYLYSTVRDADSTIRRWPDERIGRPLRVAMIRQPVDGFREEFVGNAGWAVTRWNGVIPIPLETGADSATADIVIVWTPQLDSNRAGRTDLTWDRQGVIHHALIVLATHTPAGVQLDSRRMSALALHELGHALGLNHSPDRGDVLHPVAYASDLSERDRRTARVLYELPTGSIR
jgi:predicted Zn-dependent protease